jgi:hypothetical protein
MKQYKATAVALAFLTLLSATASGVMAGVSDSGTVEMNETYQEICLDVSQNVEIDWPTVSTTSDSLVIRQRSIELHSSFYNPTLFQENTSITMNLFDNVTFISTFHTMIEYPYGITGLLGDIEGSESGFVVLSLGFEKVYGTIEIPENNQRFIIHYDSDTEMQYVSEVDVSSIGDESQRYAPTLIPDVYNYLDDELLIAEPVFNPNPWEDVTIRVGVYYTNNASIQAGGAENIALKISNEFTISNMVLAESQTYCTLEWGDLNLVTYAETGNSQTDLGALGFGEIDDIATRRNDNNLDLVSLIVKEMESDIGGRANQLQNINSGNGSVGGGFSVVKQSQLGGAHYTFIHELGHNLGCSHNTEATDGPGPTIWGQWEKYFGEVNDWSSGYHWWDGNKECLTIMSYYIGNDPTRIPHFSNPDVSYNGHPTGTDKHNNARTIRITKHIVASYMNMVTISAAEGGTTEPEAKVYNGVERGEFKEGGCSEIYPKPNQGWSFYRWSGDVPEENIYDNPLSFYVEGDNVITPQFINVVSPSFSFFEPTGWWTYNQRPTCTIDIESVQDPRIANTGELEFGVVVVNGHR